MTFKAKLRRIGNSIGVLIPLKVITDYTLGEEIELEVITKRGNKATDVITKPLEEKKVITQKKLEFNTKKGIWE